jgi:hypothetical protein
MRRILRLPSFIAIEYKKHQDSIVDKSSFRLPPPRPRPSEVFVSGTLWFGDQLLQLKEMEEVISIKMMTTKTQETPKVTAQVEIAVVPMALVPIRTPAPPQALGRLTETHLVEMIPELPGTNPTLPSTTTLPLSLPLVALVLLELGPKPLVDQLLAPLGERPTLPLEITTTLPTPRGVTQRTKTAPQSLTIRIVPLFYCGGRGQ